ncbi:MAG: radical SAM protein [Bacteroidales bacterium]|nr:radical SAM protein [Bacteroidales bacterium]
MKNKFEPSYLRLHNTGDLKRRGEKLMKRMERCDLCPRECHVNRFKGEKGFCNATSEIKIASYHPHFGEEVPLVGSGGSGTIFFSHCNLGCEFCINYDISIEGKGKIISVEDLAYIMLQLQSIGCHNINVVTPTHFSPHIILSLDIAAEKGLKLPLVYNTSGWEKYDILKILDGIVDIYLADFKYLDPEISSKYSSKAGSYPEITKNALLEMNSQVGIAKPAQNGIMFKGLMIRHLVMPNGSSDSTKVVKWIAQHLPKETYLNLMIQYRPYNNARFYPEIAHGITDHEYYKIVKTATDMGLINLDIQGNY